MLSQPYVERILAGYWLLFNGFLLPTGRIVFVPHLMFLCGVPFCFFRAPDVQRVGRPWWENVRNLSLTYVETSPSLSGYGCWPLLGYLR